MRRPSSRCCASRAPSRRRSASPSRSASRTTSSWPRSPPTSTSRAASRSSARPRPSASWPPSRSSIFFGVGKVAEARLARAGLRTVADIRRLAPADLFRLIGNDAERLHRLAHGHDARPVRVERETKTISAETTFNTDIGSLQDLEPILWRLCERLSARMKKAELAGRSITLKLKTADFKLRTRSRSGLAPTQLAGRLFKTGRALLAQECDGTRFRLIGIGASDLCEAHAERPRRPRRHGPAPRGAGRARRRQIARPFRRRRRHQGHQPARQRSGLGPGNAPDHRVGNRPRA